MKNSTKTTTDSNWLRLARKIDRYSPWVLIISLAIVTTVSVVDMFVDVPTALFLPTFLLFSFALLWCGTLDKIIKKGRSHH